MQQVPWRKSVTRGEKSIYKFHEVKNQHAASSENKNQQAKSSMSKINFTKRKINVNFSRRQKWTWNKFHEQKVSAQQVPRTKMSTQQFQNKIVFARRKINTQQALWLNSEQQVAWTELARSKFHEQNQFRKEKKIKMQQISRTKSAHNKNKINHTTSSTNGITFTRRKINVQVSRRGNSACSKFHEQESPHDKFQYQKSACNKFHEQNQFHEEKNEKSLYKFHEEKESVSQESARDKFH